MRHLTERGVKRLCGKDFSTLKPIDAGRVVSKLSDQLAVWILRPEVLDRVARDPDLSSMPRARRPAVPRLEPRTGLCLGVFAVENPDRYPLLQPAFALPLCWRRGDSHSRLLPPPLVALADQILRQFRATKKPPRLIHDSWGLHPGWCPDESRINLSGLTDQFLRCDSAWVALAGGLLVACEGGKSDPSIWATGAWRDGQGIQDVGHIEAKVAAAGQHGVRMMFVPRGQVHQAESAARTLDAALEIRPLESGETDPIDALRAYRLRLDCPPTDEDPFPERIAYYTRQDPQSDVARVYYRSHVLPELISRYRGVVETRWPRFAPDHLVAIVSKGSVELVPIAVGAIRPRRLCLILTPDDPHVHDTCSELRKSIDWMRSSLGLSVEIDDLPIAGKLDPILDADALARKLPGPSGRRVFDLTLGNKLMSLAFATPPIAHEDDLLIYWDHDFTDAGRVRPGSQRLYYRTLSTSWKPAERNSPRSV